MQALKKFLRIILSILLASSPYSLVVGQVGFSLPGNPTAAAIDYAEYFVDTDPGFGNGVSLSITSSTDITLNNSTIDLSSVSSGVHRIYFRTRDNDGIWSLTNVQTFFKLFPAVIIPSNSAATNITKAEYFIDTDPGFGNGTALPITSSNDVSANNSSLDITGITPGVHRIYFRTLDASGSWSLTNVQTFFVANVAAQIPPNPTAANIIKAEYFIDTDPGLGNGIPVSITSSTDVSVPDVAVDLTGLSNGVHRIYFRTQDANGSWSLTNVNSFQILMANVVLPPNPTAGNITKLEYFFDNDPGFGNGKTITISSTTDLSNYTFAADLTGLKNDTTHTLYVRTFDDWSLTNSTTFVIGTLLPVTWLSFNGYWKNNNHSEVLLNWQTANEVNNMEYEVQRSTDGINFLTVGKVAGSGSTADSHSYSYTDNLQGSNNLPVLYYRIKQNDIDGHFTYSTIISLRNPNALQVQVSPNPGNGIFKLWLNKKPDAEIRLSVVDSRGALIMQKNIYDVETEINLTGKPKGFYFMQLHYADGSTKNVSVELQ